MIIHRFANGDVLKKYSKAIIACFSGRRKVLSTAPHNGGYREDLKWVFNQDCNEDGKDIFALKAPTYAEHMVIIASELGLESRYAAGLITAASMNNVSIKSEAYADTTVTVVVTGGIDFNGGRVGDTALWHETEGKFVQTPGTINIMLFIEADLDEGALSRALVTCTEAKTAALQELLSPSRYSNGIATGSGTDGTIVVSDAQSPVKLTCAGKHCKLGELIGRSVIAAVKEALFLQTGLCAERQFDIIKRIDRFGITEERLWQITGNQLSHTEFSTCFMRLSGLKELVVYTSLYVHLMDQLQWGLIGYRDALPTARELLRLMKMDSAALPDTARDGAIEAMACAFSRGIVKRIIAFGKKEQG